MKKKILIVDDEPDQVFTVQKSIEASSDQFEVFSATSGEQSIEFLQTHEPPDLILLDIMMPQMDGIEVIKKIRENPSWNHIPVVFLTARTDKLSIEDSMELGDDYIEKPFHRDEFLARIQSALRIKKLRDQLEERNRQLIISQKALVRREKMATIGLLASGLAHEFNNIMGSISGYAQMARKNPKYFQPLIYAGNEKVISSGFHSTVSCTSIVFAINLVVTGIADINDVNCT